MAAVLLSNPGLPLAVLGNPRRKSVGKKTLRKKRLAALRIARREMYLRIKSIKGTNPMSKRTPRFFLRRFRRGKRNPPYDVSYHTPGGAVKTMQKFSKAKLTPKQVNQTIESLRDQGIDAISVSQRMPGPRKARRGKARKTARKARKTRKGRKHTMARKTRKTRSRARRHIRSLKRSASKMIGRTYRRKTRGMKYAVRILGVRKGHGKKRKSRAVRWSGKKGSRIYRARSWGYKTKHSPNRRGSTMIGFTNPKRRGKRRARRSTRRNPGIVGDYFGGLTSAPTKVMGLFKGPGMIKNVGFTVGGAVGTFMLGGILSSKVIKPALEKFAPGFAAKVADPSTIEARVVGGILPYTAAFAITKLFGKKLGSDLSSALLLGGAVASVVELIRPGMVGDLLKKVGLGELPYAGPALAGLGALNGPVCGLGYSDMLAGYVQASGYNGTGEYVDAPSYSGTAGYVDAPSYSGSAGIGQEQLAGSYLDDAADNSLQNNWMTGDAN